MCAYEHTPTGNAPTNTHLRTTAATPYVLTEANQLPSSLVSKGLAQKCRHPCLPGESKNTGFGMVCGGFWLRVTGGSRDGSPVYFASCGSQSGARPVKSGWLWEWDWSRW